MSVVSRLALIALGSNENAGWGAPRETIQKAMMAVGQISDKPAKFSRLFATPAFPAGSGPDYVNAAMAIVTKLSPTELLGELHEIEAAAGRTRSRRWGQRTLDLDLIAVADAVRPDVATQTRWRDLVPDDQLKQTPTELILPHPRLQDRAFVLVPLMDVAPDWVHPVLGQSIAEMASVLPATLTAEVVKLDAKDSA